MRATLTPREARAALSARPALSAALLAFADALLFGLLAS
jgi:hypothetical protein